MPQQYIPKLKNAMNLALLLAVLWLLLSGHYTVLPLVLGLFSVAVVVVICLHMGIMHDEEQKTDLNISASLLYCYWLLKEIFLSGLSVCRLILDPKMPISPQIISVPSSQSKSLTKVFFAHSITLTPGTVTIDINGDILTVHAITEYTANTLLNGHMNKKITALEK